MGNCGGSGESDDWTLVRSKRAKGRKVKIEESFKDFKNNGPFAAVTPGKKMSPSFKQEDFSFSRSPLGFCQDRGARRCASRVERRHCSLLAVVGEEGGGSRPMFPRGSVGSRRDIAAVSRSTGPLVSRIARRSSLEHAAISKLSADEKDASVFCQRDVGDGIFAGRSAFGARGGSGEGRTAPVTAVCSALRASRVSGGGRCASAAAGALDSREFVTCASSLNSSCGSSRACMSYLDAVLSAPARAPAAALVARSVAPSSSAVGLCMHAHGSLVHDACSNSWSDTVRKGPTGRKCTKGGVSGPAEDLRPVPEVVAGVNFRPAGGVRRQVVGSFSGQATGHWYQDK